MNSRYPRSKDPTIYYCDLIHVSFESLKVTDLLKILRDKIRTSNFPMSGNGFLVKLLPNNELIIKLPARQLFDNPDNISKRLLLILEGLLEGIKKIEKKKN